MDEKVLYVVLKVHKTFTDLENVFSRLSAIRNRCVAQLGRALRSGRRGRKFKSCRID